VTRIFLAGSGWFGRQAAERLIDRGHRIVGVAAPERGRRGKADLLALWAIYGGAPLTVVSTLTPEAVPEGTELILTAHSHAFIGARTRARAPYAMGYHPSLLPLHRGRDAVRWQARMGERVVGGSIYHLTDRVDGGPLHDQRHVVIPPGIDHRHLWREYLSPIGLDMLAAAADAVASGDVRVIPQDDRLATWEPSFDGAPLYRPEVLQLTGTRNHQQGDNQ